MQHGPSSRVVEYGTQYVGDPGSILLRVLFLFSFHVEQSSFIQIVDMNRFFTGTCERLVNRLSEKVVKSRILPKIQVCSENKNKHKI